MVPAEAYPAVPAWPAQADPVALVVRVVLVALVVLLEPAPPAVPVFLLTAVPVLAATVAATVVRERATLLSVLAVLLASVRDRRGFMVVAPVLLRGPAVALGGICPQAETATVA